MNKIIQVGAVVIVNHDNYWKLKNEIEKYKDMISRGLGVESEKLDTTFAKSVEKRCGSSDSVSSFDFLNQMKEACRLYELQNPVKLELLVKL